VKVGFLGGKIMDTMAIVVEIEENDFLAKSSGEQNLLLYRAMSAFLDTCDKKHNELNGRCKACEDRLGTLETEKTVAAKHGSIAGLASGGVFQFVVETIRALWK